MVEPFDNTRTVETHPGIIVTERLVHLQSFRFRVHRTPSTHRRVGGGNFSPSVCT